MLNSIRTLGSRLRAEKRGHTTSGFTRPASGHREGPGLRRLRAASRGRPLAHKMAAPAYPAWVGRWLTGQWRQKKRPPTVRPTRSLVLADKVANRRETAGGEFSAGPVNAVFPSLVPGSWPCCFTPGRVVVVSGHALIPARERLVL